AATPRPRPCAPNASASPISAGWACCPTCPSAASPCDNCATGVADGAVDEALSHPAAVAGPGGAGRPGLALVLAGPGRCGGALPRPHLHHDPGRSEGRRVG